jgi:hypothetical protein
MAKYAIEISGSLNERIVFQPTRLVIRGRWDRRNHAGRRELPLQQALFSRVQVIPGQVIELDTSAMVGRVIDPLESTQSGRAILQQINDIFKSHRMESGGEKRGKETETNQLDKDGVKEWAFHMRNLMDAGMAIPVPGSVELPDSKKILSTWAGKIRSSPLSERIEFTEKYPQYLHEVEDKKAVAS